MCRLVSLELGPSSVRKVLDFVDARSKMSEAYKESQEVLTRKPCRTPAAIEVDRSHGRGEAQAGVQLPTPGQQTLI